MSKRKKSNRGGGVISEKRQVTTGRIQEREPSRLGRVVFCFKYLDAAHKTFNVAKLPDGFAQILLNRFRDYGNMPFGSFIPNKTLHSHRADDERIEAHGGFRNVPAELWQERPWQFQIQNKMRAIGFILGPVFHVVWIDKDHKFDPRF